MNFDKSVKWLLICVTNRHGECLDLIRILFTTLRHHVANLLTTCRLIGLQHDLSWQPSKDEKFVVLPTQHIRQRKVKIFHWCLLFIFVWLQFVTLQPFNQLLWFGMIIEHNRDFNYVCCSPLHLCSRVELTVIGGNLWWTWRVVTANIRFSICLWSAGVLHWWYPVSLFRGLNHVRWMKKKIGMANGSGKQII